MYHIRLKWLTAIQLWHTAMAAALLAAFSANYLLTQPPAWINHFGIDIVIAIVASGQIIYTILIYPFIRERTIWWSHTVGAIMTLACFAVIAEKSGGYRSWVWIPWALVILLSASLGPMTPAIFVCFNLVFFVVVAAGGTSVSDAAYGPPVIAALALCGVIGWLLFRKQYTQTDQESSRIERLDSMLKEEQLKSEILIESIADGVIVINKEGAIQLFNPAAAAITGWHVDEALGIDYRSLISFFDSHEKALSEGDNPFARVLKYKEHITDDKLRLGTKSGKKIFVYLAISPIVRQQTGSLVGAIAIIRDISKQHEEESQRAEFISTASHEMRTPVAAIEGFLALALNPAVSQIDSKAKEYLEKAHSATQHLGQLFQDLLTISKAEDGRLENHPKVIEIGAVFHELVEQWRFTANKKGLELKFTIGDQNVNPTDNKVIVPLYYVEVDPERIREVFTNLFDNAVKYTAKGSISISLSGDDTTVQASITDTGTGIADEDIPHLFQKFYRIDNSATRQVGGTGLGLYICRKIVDLYHGHILVDSELGHGSKFTVSIPRIREPDATIPQASTATSNTLAAAKAAPVPGKPRPAVPAQKVIVK